MDQLQIYYKQTIFWLSTLGLWPYQNKYFRSIYNIFIFFVYVSFLGAQITAITNGKHTMFDLLRNMLYIPVLMASSLKSGTYYFQADAIKQLMEEVNRDWRTHNDEPLEILRNFANSGKRYSFYFALIIFIPAFTIIGFETCNSILDAVAPLNYTRPSVIPGVYFADERKYRFLVLIYRSYTLLVFASALVGAESLVIMLMHHFGALYVLVSYYIYQGVMEHISHSSSRHLGNSKRLLITAVVIHKRVIKCMNIFDNIMSLSYIFLILLLTIPALSIDIYFIYSTNWYEASLSTQKFLLFVMTKTSEKLRLKLFIVFKPTLEGFVQILKVCFSYFTVIASIEERHQ